MEEFVTGLRVACLVDGSAVFGDIVLHLAADSGAG
jgi:hypothetical protein